TMPTLSIRLTAMRRLYNESSLGKRTAGRCAPMRPITCPPVCTHTTVWLYHSVIKRESSKRKLVSIARRPVRRLSETNEPGARLDHVRQRRFALRNVPPGRHHCQRVQLGPLRTHWAAHDWRIRFGQRLVLLCGA